jgi:hypothetical protein
MSVVLKSTGGAQIGWMNATWPLARLTASAHQLSLSGLLLGTYAFSPSDVANLKPYGWLPILGRGIQIIHTNANYPPKIIFWCLGPERLIRRINALGFQPRAPLTAVPKRNGIPFRWSFLIAVLVVWNALFLLDDFVPWKEPRGPGIYTLLALLILFVTSVAAARSEAFQVLVLKPGRSVTEIRPVLNLVQLISGVMLIAFAAQYLAS